MLPQISKASPVDLPHPYGKKHKHFSKMDGAKLRP